MIPLSTFASNPLHYPVRPRYAWLLIALAPLMVPVQIAAIAAQA